MAIFVVMEPPGVSRNAAADGAVFVRDGFSLPAFLVPPLWLLWQKLWIEATLALAIGMALTTLGEMAGFGFPGALLFLLVSVYVGLEGAALRLNALDRRGWREWGVIEAGNLAEAEIRYLSGQENEVAVPDAPLAIRPMGATARPAHLGPALGLFHYPGKP